MPRNHQERAAMAWTWPCRPCRTSTPPPLFPSTIGLTTMSRSKPRIPEDRQYPPLVARKPTGPGRRAPTTFLARRERHGDVAVHGHERHGHAAFAVHRRTPTKPARPGTWLATRSSPDMLTPWRPRTPARTSAPATAAPMEPTEPLNTKFYQLGNGGDLIFEHDLNALSDFLGRPHPEFHGIQMNDQVGGELQWIITADLRGKLEPPTSERILFSIRESNWLDGLARGLQEALARLCGQNVVRLLASRFAHLVRRDAMGVPMALQSHPQLRHHAEHLDYMLYNTQKELDNFRAYANRTHLALVTHGDAIKQLSKDRNKLRLKCAKKDVTITRLRAQIASLESTVKAQEDQLREMEEDEAGADPGRRRLPE
ncbi:hypothetical protein QYE76_022573 [Lolium multiflorum]|uniref:Uncharacterized protein n=1 Tax=Lolium multiflorum TaxID=4521 RepID=A0AAD8RA21_LOLMU|nr:hypothetical protein QYE76_022573 [Lolium multiflorum]